MDPVIGERIGGYRIDALAGRGGMGAVYRATQERPARSVAIKVIASRYSDDPEFRARFEHESNVAAQIEHPNVIPVYEVGEDDGRLFIAMRFVEGSDLRELRSGGPIATAVVVRIVGEVAAALDAAHAHGLVHRDVKPANILISGGTADGHVYLTDFGVTKRLGESQPMTATGAFLGTVDYIAPEQAMGHGIDGRADIYALGCVLYELLSGAIPFPRDTDVAKIFAHVNDPPRPLTEVAPDVPLALSAVVLKAMAKDPDDRYASAGDFARAAQAALAGRTDTSPGRSVARGAAAPAPSRRPAPRRRVLAGGAAALVAAGGLVAVLAGGGATGTGGPLRAGTTGGIATTGRFTAASAATLTVALAWDHALNAGDFEKAGSYFAADADANGNILHTPADAAEYNRVLGCGGKVSSVQVDGDTVTLVYDHLTQVPNGGECQKKFIGRQGSAGIRVRDGKIVRFR